MFLANTYEHAPHHSSIVGETGKAESLNIVEMGFIDPYSQNYEQHISISH